jgi:ketosteroid isomerase-like protein
MDPLNICGWRPIDDKERSLSDARSVVAAFYDAVQQGDMMSARRFLADDMTFIGLFETYPDADTYIATFTGLMQIVIRLDIEAIIGDGGEVAIFYRMHTAEPAPGVTLVAEWHEVRDGRIVKARSAFDGRPFAAMFGGGGPEAKGVETVRRFEEEFKNQGNHSIVDSLMTDDFVHHLPYGGLPSGRDGMKAVGELVTGLINDIRVTVSMTVADGGLVADRVEAAGVRVDNGQPIRWVENHIYRLRDGRISELWPAGGPDLSQ